MSVGLPSAFTIFPLQLLQKVDKIFWQFQETPLSYLEITHRSPQYTKTNEQSMKVLAKYYNVPENYQILYLPIDCGHPSVPFNLNIITNNRAFYLVTDKQSESAYQEALRINPATVKIDRMEDRASVIQPLGEPFYFYTFYSKLSLQNGQYIKDPQPLDGQILVCTTTNCSLYQDIDISKHGIVLFQTGRGLSLTGMDVLIVRKDLFGKQLPTCPDMFCYEKTLNMSSVGNTPHVLVTLFLREQLQYNLASDYTLEKTRDQLKAIKHQYETELAKYTQVESTQAQGLIKFKLPAHSQAQQVEQYGFLKGQWLVINLQLPNKGKAAVFAEKLFK